MSQETKIKVLDKNDKKKAIVNKTLSSFVKYDSLTEMIYKKSKFTSKDKIILRIDDFNISGLDSIFNSDTFNYFVDKVKTKNPTKTTLYIEKVDDYPKWNPPQFLTIFKNSLASGWEKAKNRIKEGITEKDLLDGKNSFIESRTKDDQNLNNINVFVICNNCLNSDFRGPRYICSECDNYNLCNFCQEKARAAHNPEHTFIILSKQDFNDVEEDIQLFSSIFHDNKRLLKINRGPYEIEVDITNNGEEPLQGCFISPIRFGKNYLGCLKKTITDECNKAEQTKIKVVITFEDEKDEVEDIYYGYYRLMTRKGIPFGDILYIQVEINNN